MIRGKGRPRSSRIRNEIDLKEPSVKIRCGLCKIEGHNRRNCPKMMEGVPLVKPEKNSIFLKKSKTVISIENQKFSRSRMTKRTGPLNSSHEI